ncbi:hypothetical protein TcCL_ESM10094, partial [Trypanosoma cruzi]
VRCVVAAGFWPFPWGCGNELGEMVVDIFFSCMVGGFWRCVPSLRGCRLVVCELCGWACCPLLMLSALSLAVSAALRPFPSRSIPFPSVSRISSLTPVTPPRVMMTAIMTMVTVRLRVVCAVMVLALLCCCCTSVCVMGAGSAGHVSGDADAVVVPVDVLCAPSDGSLSYRVRACVWAWKRCSPASAEAQYENYTFSGFDVRMHGRDGELGAVCHVANAVHTSSNCAASCATKEEGATVAFTMNVTTHKYAGLYELWWRQFSPDGTIHPPARSSDADQTGIFQLPPPREGKDDTKSVGTTAPQVDAEPTRQNEDWRQSAAADGPNTVDQSPASNTATNTSETKPEFAFVRNIKVVPTPPERRFTPVTESKEDPIVDAMSGSINVELPRGVDLFFSQKKVLQLRDEVVSGTSRDSFVLPTLVRAGGVIAAFAEGHIWMPDIKVVN